MSYTEFVNMHAADLKVTPESLLQARPLSFPISTNRRGEELVEFFKRTVALDLSRKRILDVGCAYGGLSIALAKAGGAVSGIDVSSRFIKYAEANASNTVDVDFHVVDASGIGIRKLFKKGSFDLIVINDVLEHIYDTTSLAANLDWLLSETGFIYFKVPNGFSPRFALSEGHRKIFGLTLLDPDCWFHLYPKRASIFYRPLGYFQAIFSYFNMQQIVFVDEERVFARFSLRKLKNEIKEIFNAARTYKYPNSQVKSYLQDGILRFRDEYLYDTESRSEDFVKFKYGSYFFTGFAGRKAAQIVPRHAIMDVDGIGRVADRGAAPARESIAARGLTNDQVNCEWNAEDAEICA
jgi:2-polyprenyl-3-methyl-5-hydroxy-6-metoxy-1,4-benzoquinol methylase